MVFGINPQSAESHREFSVRYQFPFPLLDDEGQKVAALYNPDSGLVIRTVYLIGLTGRSVTPVAVCRAPMRCWRPQ
jgi:peroxiredoxin Q/BCP